MRVLSWNLFHGRSVPPAGRDLLGEFSTALAGWEWDVALLQEVPPWWPPTLAATCGAEQRTVLTSRNAGLPVRRRLAERIPDLVKSNGGGANALLVRGEIRAHRWRTLRRWPERRVVQAVALADGTWVANLHASAHRPDRARADLRLARATALAWAGDAPLLLGGDLNLRLVSLPGFEHLAGHSVDHLLARGLRRAGDPPRLARGRLSDHAPLAVVVVR